MSTLHVHFLPPLVEPDALRGGTVVVIDVLRATTTIAAALASGAREVVPCGEIAEALQIAARYPEGEVLLGGERGGVRIEGFDLGNSPSDYSPERVAGKTIVFTTTNGTQALLRCRQAARVLTAGFANLSAVAKAVQDVAQAAEDSARIHLLCAGTRGRITREDVVVAGCLGNRIRELALEGVGIAPRLDDSAEIACDAAANRDADFLREALVQSQGGRDLEELGMARDIVDAAMMDRWPGVPELDLAAWALRSRA